MPDDGDELGRPGARATHQATNGNDGIGRGAGQRDQESERWELGQGLPPLPTEHELTAASTCAQRGCLARDLACCRSLCKCSL
jgi:hypothetical protein